MAIMLAAGDISGGSRNLPAFIGALSLDGSPAISDQHINEAIQYRPAIGKV